MENLEVILWKGIPLPGHEACRMYSQDAGWHLEGTAVFAYESQPCLLSYLINCDPAWNTLSVRVNGWVGPNDVSIQIRADAEHRWWLNEVEAREVAGCIDVDLNFSPSTNLIPIRRLNLKEGEKADLVAAWLRFPSFNLEPLAQSYERLDETAYRYKSGNGRFIADLRVRPDGLAAEYPGIWIEEKRA